MSRPFSPGESKFEVLRAQAEPPSSDDDTLTPEARRVLALLERNIERNGAGDFIRAVAWDVARDEVPAWNVLGSWNVLVAADVLYSAEAAKSLPGVVAALPDLREIWLAHTHRGAGDRLDSTIEALSATFPVAEVVERVRDTRVVVLRRQS